MPDPTDVNALLDNIRAKLDAIARLADDLAERAEDQETQPEDPEKDGLLTKASAAVAAKFAADLVVFAVNRELNTPTASADSVARAATEAADFAATIAPGLAVLTPSTVGGLGAIPVGTASGAVAGGIGGTAVGGILGLATDVGMATGGAGTVIGLTGGGQVGAIAGGAIGGSAGAILGAAAGAAFGHTFLSRGARYGATHVRDYVREKVCESYGTEIARRPFLKRSPDTIDLDAVYPKIVADRWIVLAKPDEAGLFRISDVDEASRAEYSITGKTTRLTLEGDVSSFADYVRATTVFAQSEMQELAEVPLNRPVPDSDTDPDSDQLLLEEEVALPEGRLMILAGGSFRKLVTVTHVEYRLDSAPRTLVTFRPPLGSSVGRQTLKIYGNVALATHGQTRHEVLGSGDGSQPFQSFVLRETPITYVTSSTNENGTESTLEVWVDHFRWTEAATFYELGPSERKYITRLRDDGRLVVQFGDGITGARLPTGIENVRAVYRVGTGRFGNVPAGQLKLLLTRPLAIGAVVNPMAAGGGDDPEVIEDARRNAPVTVLTMGRLVSLQDYEDYARTFGGVAKAMARWAWFDGLRGVHVTVAGVRGEDLTDSTLTSLKNGMTARDGRYIPIEVTAFRPVPFFIRGTVDLDPAVDVAYATAAVTDSLRASFGFRARALGQPVSMAEIVAVIHASPGVRAVDVASLRRVNQSEWRRHWIEADTPEDGAASDAPGAELLTLSESLELTFRVRP
jgi:hypothetical protein